MKTVVIALAGLALAVMLAFVIGSVLLTETPNRGAADPRSVNQPEKRPSTEASEAADSAPRPPHTAAHRPAVTPAAGARSDRPVSPPPAAGGVVFAGRVESAGGGPLAGARVEYTWAPGAAGRTDLADFSRWKTVVRSIVSDRDGGFRFRGVGAGVGRVRISAAGHRELLERVVLPPDGSRGRVYTLRLALAIRGRVVNDEGKPVGLARVNAAGGKGAASHGGALSGQDGVFVIDGLEPGPHDLSVHARGFTAFRRSRVPAGGEPVEVVLTRTGSISGRVTRARTGEPVERFRVQLGRTLGSGEIRWTRRVVEGRDGVFRSELDAGNYRVLVQADALPTTTRDGIRILAGRETAGIEIAVGEGGRIAGSVSFQGGPRPEDAAVGAVRLLASGRLDGESRRIRARIDPAGAFESRGLTPGRWRITLEAHGWTADPIPPVRVDEGAVVPLAIVARRSGRLMVRVTGPGGEVPTRGDWRVTDAKGRTRAGVFRKPSGPPIPVPLPRPETAPGFSISEEVAPGRARLEVNVPGCAAVRRTVEVRGGEKTRVHVSLRAR